MSDAQTPPGGLSWAHFQSICADVSDWTWGTVQGAFNEKSTTSQVLVDAAIGMIPIAGDVTAVRDLIATIMGLINDPKKRESTWSWILLVVFLLALIPVFGGVAKGAGRIAVRVLEDASKVVGPERVKLITEGAQEITKFLNRIGGGNAERWFANFHPAAYQAEIMEKFNDFTSMLDRTLGQVQKKMGSLMPEELGNAIQKMRKAFVDIKEKGAEMIPNAIKEFDQKLREIQACIYSGGETTSRTALHEVATGDRAVTRAEESRLIEDGVLPQRSALGGWKQNAADPMKPKTWGGYKPEPGYPDLTKRVDDGRLSQIAAFSGAIANRELREGEGLYRVFGKAGDTHGVEVGEAYSGGAWWGVGEAPKTAKEWRKKSGVLDEWNRDGFIVEAKIGKSPGPKACVGTISEQSGKKLPGQYLEGGGTQAFFYMDQDAQKMLTFLGQHVMETGQPFEWVDKASGMIFNIRPTGWKDANGIWGYIRGPSPGQVATVGLAKSELSSKNSDQVVVNP